MYAMNLSAHSVANDAGVGGRSDAKPGALPVLYATYPLSRSAGRAHAWSEIVRGARAYRLWATLPLIEYVDLFRHTIVGPLLPIINRGLSFLLAGLLLGKLTDSGARYIAHLTVGLIVWFLIHSLITNGPGTLVRARRFVLQTDSPVVSHVFETVWRAFIDFGLSIVLLFVAAAIVWRWPDWRGLLAIPGILLVLLNGVWVTLVLATVSLKYRVLVGLTRRTMRIAFLATPIMWMANHFPNHQTLIRLNPFYHCVEIVRGPLLGNPPPLASWAVVVGIAVVGWCAAIRIYAHYRKQIPFLV